MRAQRSASPSAATPGVESAHRIWLKRLPKTESASGNFYRRCFKSPARRESFAYPHMARVQLLVCIAALLSLTSAANPTVKVGVTLAKCGLAAQIAQPAEESLRWWANYTNTHGGIVINGTVHDVELVMCVSRNAKCASHILGHLSHLVRRYNDASDLELTGAYH